MKKRWTTLAYLLFFIIFLVILVPRLLHVQKLKVRNEKLEREIQQLHFENRQMDRELRLLKEDPVHLEKVAREKFKKAKPGEIVYKVVRE